ncbi:efflux transporter outer membrane subunit [Alkalimarinus coralli]|uniref:efflux transporter outer membrane subunit n=1 Tax=Alkalimarinus coralli TaxID=2935863 RepID=UPI00202B0266|nr:efflux transporter outer membrane subunit [Alkalimarinus coralli]
MKTLHLVISELSALRHIFRLGQMSLITLLAACASPYQPEYTQPAVPEKEAWKASIPDSQDVIRPDWWAGFEDAYLNQLVDQAVAGDYDLKLLATRIEIAAAAAGVERANALPKFSPDASKRFQRDPTGDSDTYSLSFSSSWELDVWGRVQKGIESKESEFRATEADWVAGYLKLVADVSSKYFEIRKLDRQIEQQKKSIEQNDKILAIYQFQIAEGLVSKSKVLQQEAEAFSKHKELLEFKRQRDVAENQLATLLGVPSGEFNVPTDVTQNEIVIPAVPVGLPSTLLSRRPDIIAQEYRVLAAYQLLGQAKLEKLPKFSLTADGGVSSNTLSQLLNKWSLGLAPSVSIPIFDKSISANIRSNEAQVKLAEDQYRQTVIKAFEEVETTLVNIASRKEQRNSLLLQVENLEVVNRNTNTQLKEGLVSQLEVFEVERTLLSAKQSVLDVDQQILADTVKLYKALGGGWSETDIR